VRLQQLGESAEEQETVGLRGMVQSGARRAILTTMCLDLPWLETACPGLCHAREVHISCGPEYAAAPRNRSCRLTGCIVPVPQQSLRGVNHGKIMVLEYSGSVRVVVTSANLIEIDYERKSQSLWYQDFPARSAPHLDAGSADAGRAHWPAHARDFADTLADYLRRLGLPYAFLSEYDFSPATVVLVTSVPKATDVDAPQRYGYAKVRQWLEKLGPSPDSDEGSLVVQCSSIGTLSDKWVRSFCRGFGARDSALRLVWPGVDFIRNCVDGYVAGTSLFLSETSVARKSTRPYFTGQLYHYRPHESGPLRKRRRAPPHIKTIYYQPRGTTEYTLYYTGSHNFSKAAWGEECRTWGGKLGPWFVTRNFEVGVLFHKALLGDQEYASPDSEAAPGKVLLPTPYRHPCDRLHVDEHLSANAPWIHTRSYAMPDQLGFRYPLAPL